MFFISPKQVEAFPVEEVGPVSGVLIPGIPAIATATAESAIVNTLTSIGVGDAVTANSTIGTLKSSVGGTCGGILLAADKLEAFDSVDSLVGGAGSQTLDALSGGIVEATKTSSQIVSATAAKECIDDYLAVLQQAPVSSLLIGQAVQGEQTKFATISSSLREKIDQLKARQGASFKDIVRAFMVKLVLNLNQSLTTNLVNNMVQKYKIDDYLAYGDAVTTQVYSMKYINENYSGDARTQMMLRSLIQSEKAPEQARVAVQFAKSKADQNLKRNCDNVGASSTLGTGYDFYKCLATYGSFETSPSYQYLTALDMASSVKGKAQASAKAEIDSSEGFAPPRDCSGSLEQQQSIDAKYQKTSIELEAANKVYERLEIAYKNGKTSKAELEKAEQALIAVGDRFNKLPEENSSPVIDICKAIDSPGGYVGNQLNSYIDQYLNQSAQLKSDNLPFYAEFASSVASNFLNNLITGGKSNSKLLKEAGISAILPVGIDTVGAILSSGGSSSSSDIFGTDQISAYFTKQGSSSKVTSMTTGQKYTLNIDFSGYFKNSSNQPIAKVTFEDRDDKILQTVGINNLSASNSLIKLEITAPKRVNNDGSSEYRIIDVLITTGGGGEPTRIGMGYNLSGPSGTVRGVSVVEVLPRGPMPVFSPR